MHTSSCFQKNAGSFKTLQSMHRIDSSPAKVYITLTDKLTLYKIKSEYTFVDLLQFVCNGERTMSQLEVITLLSITYWKPFL